VVCILCDFAQNARRGGMSLLNFLLGESIFDDALNFHVFFFRNRTGDWI